MLLLAWAVGISRWIAELAAITAIVGYLAAVGWQPLVVRAGVSGVLNPEGRSPSKPHVLAPVILEQATGRVQRA